ATRRTRRCTTPSARRDCSASSSTAGNRCRTARASSTGCRSITTGRFEGNANAWSFASSLRLRIRRHRPVTCRRCNRAMRQNAVMQKRILIVEDEASIREMVAFALRKAGREPVHAEDARAAQWAIADAVPDLILLDWMLPGMSGLELARRLTREDMTREVPIIMLTARGEEMDRVNGLEAGVDDYVV